MKPTTIKVKSTKTESVQKSPSDSSLVISSKKVDQALEKRKKDKNKIEEFTEWK